MNPASQPRTPTEDELTAEWVESTVRAHFARRNATLAPHEQLGVRPYQVEAWVALLRAYFLDHSHRQMLVLPTGCGKTVTFATLAWLLWTLKGQPQRVRVLVLAHRDVLVKQAMKTFRRVWPEATVGFLAKGEPVSYGRDITGAMVPTLGRRDQLHPREWCPKLQRVVAHGPYDLVIIDESHHSAADTYVRTLEAVQGPSTLRLGVTATPNRADGLSLRELYDQITYSYSLIEAIESGYLVRPVGVRCKLHLDLDEIRTSKSQGGDFSEEAIGAVFNTPEVRAKCLAAWQQYARGKKTILFACTVDHAIQLAETFRAAGISAKAIHGGHSEEERLRMYDRLAKGELTVLVSVLVLTEGFDEPSVECVYMARPTQSWSLFVQMVGRGLRLHPSKSECLILDVTGNSTKYSLRGLNMLGGFRVDEVEESQKPKPEDAGELAGMPGADRSDREHQHDLFAPSVHGDRIDLVGVKRVGRFQWQDTEFGKALMLGGPDLGGIFLVRQHDCERDKLPKYCAGLFKIVHLQRRGELESKVDAAGGYTVEEIGKKLPLEEALALCEQEAPRLGAKRSRAGLDESGIRAATDEEVRTAVADVTVRNREINQRLKTPVRFAAQKPSDAQVQCLRRELGLTSEQLAHPELTRGEAQRLIVWGKAAGFKAVRLPAFLIAKSEPQSQEMAG
jgi:superfamily II DNA or RNA helicase